jgi:NADPH-dependent 2,4-dienoyl-CoA reductase/sulfur reductase-like enzyme
LLCAEAQLPYHRPPLSKDLLWGKKTFSQIYVFDKAYYRREKVDLRLKTVVETVQAGERFVVDAAGHQYGYSQLLIATGGSPRKFPQAGNAVHYFRNAQDYLNLAKAMTRTGDFLVVGAGFIGAELSAALSRRGKKVTMLFKGKTLLENIFPPDLSDFVTDLYRQKGVSIIAGDEPADFFQGENQVRVITRGGKELKTGWVIAGIGIDPESELAKSAGLQIDNGLVVNRYLQTSRPEIFAAGDLARFPCEALGENIRLEHWDNAMAQGTRAGANMAGGFQPYDYLPYFYSDLFDLGFEAVGRLDSQMKTLSAWEVPFRKGVVVYLKDGKVRGVLLWNQNKMLDWARKLIVEQAHPESVEDLKRLLPALLTV